MSSPGVRPASEVLLQRGYRNAAAAYNAAISSATSDLLIFAHQDVYFPDGWINSVFHALHLLEKSDPNWGVLGVWGAAGERVREGYLYWTGDFGWERPPEAPRQVVSLDEVVLILRRSSGLRFDEALPGFHMYGTDICLESQARGRHCYAINAFCIHNTNIGHILPLAFWKSYLFMRGKWRTCLPVHTPCVTISWSCWPVLRWNLVFLRDLLLRSTQRIMRATNPADLHRQIVARGLVRDNLAEGVSAK